MLTMSAGASLAEDVQSVSIDEMEGGVAWFVELSGPPVADGGSVDTVRAEKAAFRRAAQAAGIGLQERYSYDVLFNGLSVSVSDGDRGKLAALAGVKALYPVVLIERPDVHVAPSEPDLVSALSQTGADIAQNALGLTGQGVKVAIIDTGVDIDHPAFGGGGVNGGTAFPTARIVAGYDFVGNAFDGQTNVTPVPDNNPDDCEGHGTHVAGIVGGNGGGIRGVAPRATLLAYRVFGCTGVTSADIMIAAMERAYEDGAQVANQSIGSSRQWPQYPTAQAATRMVNKGVVMVASIGNNGPGGSQPDGLFAAGAPGVGTKVIGVASYDNAQRSFTVNGTSYGYNPASGSPLPPTSGSLPMARTGTSASTADACAALPAGSLTGAAVLIRRGTCSFYQKSRNAQLAGAAAVVLYNNAAGALNATVAGSPAVTIPVVGITAAQGTTLDGLIAAGATSLTWTADFVSYPFGTGGLISGFSSYGLAADLQLKPNLGAPGGGILSSYPLEKGTAAVLSGTSMSSPHVAGGVALVLEARPRTPSNAMRDLLQNSADPKVWSGSPGLGLVESVHRQGAGMLDIVAAVESTTSVSPAQISLGESEAGPRTVTLTVRNDASSAVTYGLSHVAGIATGPNTQTGASYAPSAFFSAPATVSFSAPSVTVPAGGTATVDATITANASLVARGIYGGYIVLTPQGGGATYRVPFAGFQGDYQSTQVLTPTANGFPWLANLSGGSFFNRNATGFTYSMVGTNIPYVLMHLDHQSRRIRIEAFDADTGKSWHRVSDDEFVGRNATPGGFFSFAWGGTTFTGKGKNGSQQYTVPNGRYVLKVSVLKALGDEANPAHWETFTTNVITIARP